MSNIYYMIWADAIISFKRHHPDSKDWKIKLFLLITWMNALNAWVIFIWLKYFDIYTIPLININFFVGEMIDEFLAFSIQFALPFAIFNYFMIFHNNRYKKITKKYENLRLRYAQIYSYSMIFGTFISAILYSIFT